MANACTNILFIAGIKDKKEKESITAFMRSRFNVFYEDEGESCIEMGFISYTGFPEDEMKELTIKLEAPGLTAGLISYDFSVSSYLSYKNGVWENKIKNE